MRKAFTMLELLVTIIIIAIVAMIALSFVGNYTQRAKQAAVRQTVQVLNESLNEYRALGGMEKAHSLEGPIGTTLNAATVTGAVVSAMKTGFTNFGKHLSFVKTGQKIDTTAVGSTGQGKNFRFVAGQSTASDTSTPTIVSVTPKLSVEVADVAYGKSETLTVSATDESGAAIAALDGQAVSVEVISSGDVTVTSKTLTLSAGQSSWSLPSESWAVGTYTVKATLSAFESGNTQYAAASGTSVLTISKAVQSEVVISPSSKTIYLGDSLTLTASGGSGSGVYTWGGDASGTGSSVDVTFSSVGSYSVTLYKVGDVSYNDSSLVTATVTVSNTSLPAQDSLLWELVSDQNVTLSGTTVTKWMSTNSAVSFVTDVGSPQATGTVNGYVPVVFTSDRLTSSAAVSLPTGASPWTLVLLRRYAPAGYSTTKGYAADTGYSCGNAARALMVTTGGFVNFVTNGTSYGFNGASGWSWAWTVDIVTYDGTTLKTYLGNGLRASTAVTLNLANTKFSLGGSYANTTYHLDALILGAATYNKELSAAEIAGVVSYYNAKYALSM